MKKTYLYIIVFTIILTISGCGSLNSNEERVYNALINASGYFHDPISMQVFSCSDIFSGSDSSQYISNGKYYPIHNPKFAKIEEKHDFVFIKISANTKGGGKTTEVYCMDLDAGNLWRYSDVLDFYKIQSGDNTKLAAAYIQLKDTEAAFNLGCELAESGDYPLTESSEIDVKKLNNKLESHWKEKGLK